jgi:hypothetical protein
MVQIKHMRYNGSDKWGPFYSKFTSIAEYQRWTETDKMFALSLVLEGTALEYYDLLKTRNAYIPFSTLGQRMAERFGQQALRPAANLEFNSMSQRASETLEHRGDDHGPTGFW